MPVQSKVKQYTAEELDLALISDKCFEKLQHFHLVMRFHEFFFVVTIFRK